MNFVNDFGCCIQLHGQLLHADDLIVVAILQHCKQFSTIHVIYTQVNQ
jgi:hypothetical protein